MHRKLVLLLSVMIALPGCMGNHEHHDNSYHFNGQEYNPARQAPDFTLTDQHGETISLSDFEGKVVVVAFTYTSCPDVCLAIEANLHAVNNNDTIAGDENFVILSITIDPARDTQEHLLEWTNQRGYNWPHLTSDNPEDFENDDKTGVWDLYHLLVNNDHIQSNHSDHSNHSEMSHQVAVLYPDNSTALLDGHHDMLPEENATGWNLTTSTLMMNNISMNSTHYECCGNMLTEINGHEAPSDSSWWWNLYHWNETNSSWDYDPNKGADDIIIMHDTNHIAWAASNANTSQLPTPGMVMDMDHEHDHGETELADDEEIYTVGHNTVTFIIDMEGNKRIVHIGQDWTPSEFVQDVEYLLGYHSETDEIEHHH